MLSHLIKQYCDKQTYSIRCRLCRKQLLVSNKIKFSHSGKAEPCGNCLFLDEEFLPDWIKDEIENLSWTKGRLKCPSAECTARIGGFDFVQGLLCGCGEFTIPAIWIQDGKVDVRAINSNDIMVKSEPSLMSSDQSNSRQMPELKGSLNEDCLMQQFQCQGLEETCINKSAISDQTGCIHNMSDTKLGKTSKRSPETFSQSIGKTRTNRAHTHEWTGCINNISDTNTVGVISKPSHGSLGEAIGESNGMNTGTSVLDTKSDNMSYTNSAEVISKPNRESFCQGRGDIYEVGFRQCINHDSVTHIGIAKIKTRGLTTLTHPPTSMVKQRKNFARHSKSSTEQKVDQTQNVAKPELIKLGTKTLSNRFNPLEVEEPATVRPLDHTSPNTAMQEHLVCAVCLDYFYKPYQCPCSHIFCESCLRQLYHNRAGTLKCPICRNPVKYIEPANQIREEIRQLQNPSIKDRELFEKTAKYKKWPLPPIGPLPFLKRRQTLVPSQDKNLVILASILLLVVCYTILYILP